MKKRLDVILVERGLAASRTQAAGMIMAGEVSSEGRVLDKPGVSQDETIELTIKNPPQYVSRGGDKLASVADSLGLDFAGKTVLDVGSSTGGFTDYALQYGAAKVFCVDVGNAQLAYKLRGDDRVVVMERTDIRNVLAPNEKILNQVQDVKSILPEMVDMIVMDVSFISAIKVLAGLPRFLKDGGSIVVMAKPQFEAGKAIADRYEGVIPVGPVRDEILSGLETEISEQFEIVAQADSGLAGVHGNLERFYKLVPKSKL
jgi:23S rRNA (cytidine1920-2'-O)/16S rRNA (cytidine1409-2'-O)-methyltransferase